MESTGRQPGTIGRIIKAAERGDFSEITSLAGEPLNGRGPWLQFRVARKVEWNRYWIPIVGLHPRLEGLRLLQLTDLHFKPFWSTAYEDLARRVMGRAPDLILMTGDFVDDKADAGPTLPHVLRFLSLLGARLGMYAILGNHDGDLVGAYLKAAGVTMIEDRCVRLSDGEAALELIGTTCVGREDFDEGFLTSLPAKPAGAARIVMSHYPDTLRHLDVTPGVDVMLAGHTHGGQVCLPGGRMLITHDSLPRELCAGVHRVGNVWMSVCRGIGFSSLPVRVFCPAEVVEVVLGRGEGEGVS